MKNKKIFTVVLLLAVSALLFTSCAFKMNTEQKALYEEFISEVETAAKAREVPAAQITAGLALYNVAANTLNFKIVDKKEGKAVAQNTSAAELRKRFVPKKK